MEALRPDYFIYFTDRDVKGVPQGYRGVAVEKVGWKWVSCRLSATGKPFKMRRSVWDALKKTDCQEPNSQL